MADELRRDDGLLATKSTVAACLNCGAPLTGAFCASCGQRDIPPYPSVRELVVDAAAEFSGWDGRLANTLRDLIRRPGLLTHEFLEGRRVRSISPIRLYLVTSLVYFLLAASAPNVRLESGQPVFEGLRVGTTKTKDKPVSRAERVGNAARQSLENQQVLTAAERDSALKDIARAPAVMRPFLRRAVEDPGGFKRRLLETMPRMLFVLLPIFAGIVALFYRGRKYPEHLYFAIHLHAFIFLALATAALVKFTQIPLLVAAAGLIVVIWIPVYATRAFRRVYGGSLSRTLMKELAIGAIYCVAAAIGFTVMIYWVSIAA
ncbi:MAG TPA: DUF3667 domain-containing protein [Gemmatimonadaceae bacterium]|nr:DUF3667 domain-containing protein [Gemmatimonadaceae bacterium]